MKIGLLLFLIASGLSGALPTNALQIADYPGFLNLRVGMSLTELVSSIFSFILVIAGLAAFVMIVWGGIKYLTSSGDPSKTRDARDQIFAAILGIIILFSSWIILNTINPDLVNIREPGIVPQPEATPPEVPIEPAEELPAAFIYIPLGQIIDNVISQEKESSLRMREFAELAGQCGLDYCDGGTCEYWVSEPCPEDGNGEDENGDENGNAHFDEGAEGEDGDESENGGAHFDWLPIKVPFVYAQGGCGHWETCSAPCNTGDPCPANKDEVVSTVFAAADQMEEEMTKLQEGKAKISRCILQEEETLLLSCQEALDIFWTDEGEEALPQWETIKGCNQGYDFYCAYGIDEDAVLEKIVFPFKTIEKSIETTRELENIVSGCDCSSASFCCECCDACSGTPCPSEAYAAAASAVEAVNELENRMKILEETIAEISLYSMADEIKTLTCSEAYSWLRLIKGGGCPGVSVFPCCPVDTETEEIIRTCQGTDFFFCIAP